MPLPGCRRIGWQRPSQPLKSPTTLTRLALGAHTAKVTPSISVDARRVGAELFVDAVVRALAEQVQVIAGQRGGEPVGVLDLPDMAALVHHAEAIGVRHLLRHGRRPEARGVKGRHGVRPAVAAGRDQGHLPRLGQEGADRRAALPVPVRAEHGEGIAVLTRGDRANDLGRKLHATIVRQARQPQPFSMVRITAV